MKMNKNTPYETEARATLEVVLTGDVVKCDGRYSVDDFRVFMFADPAKTFIHEGSIPGRVPWVDITLQLSEWDRQKLMDDMIKNFIIDEDEGAV